MHRYRQLDDAFLALRDRHIAMAERQSASSADPLGVLFTHMDELDEIHAIRESSQH